MKLTLYASAAILALGITGCDTSNTSRQFNAEVNQTVQKHKFDSNAKIIIKDQNGKPVSVDPSKGGVVVVGEDDTTGTKNVDVVVPGYINSCMDKTTDPDGDGVICGPKKGITYAFQLDFGKLGPLDNDKETPDGGALLYDAVSHYDGKNHDIPVSIDKAENRIRTVYIPTNYIKLSDAAKQYSIDKQYQVMRSYLSDICNMQCMAHENKNNKFFKDGKSEAKFVATYIMLFTRGEDEKNLMNRLQTNKSDLEFLGLSFELDVKKNADNNLTFSSPEGSRVTLYGKRHGEGEVVISADNKALNSVLHTNHDYVHPSFSINMAKYFDKLIQKGDAIGISDYAKRILVENAQKPWPVKIYATLHEINNDKSFDRSFVRNPAKLDASIFGLDTSGDYKEAFANETPHITGRGFAQTMKFAIVYPGQ